MKSIFPIWLIVYVLLIPQIVVGQTETSTKQIEVSRENREQSFAKLMEAQRYMWRLKSVRGPESLLQTLTKSAKEALQKAIQLNPNLAEAYTAQAELIAYSTLPEVSNLSEAALLANIAAKIDPDSFGAHSLLARIYTINSRINSQNYNQMFGERAIKHWKEVTRLDSRNAEAWAILAKFYEKVNKNEEKISSLKKWLAAASPVESRFYEVIFGNEEKLTPETAGLKLAEVFIKENRYGEAFDILSQIVSTEPNNEFAVDLLRQSIQSGNINADKKMVEVLQQAVFANPTNLILVELLAESQVQLGNTDDAIITINRSINKLDKTDKINSANLTILIGDFYSQSNRIDEALLAFEKSLSMFAIDKNELETEDQREFATRVYERIINVQKNAGRKEDAKKSIERAANLLGKGDLFAEKQMLALLREQRKHQEALILVRSLRKVFADDYSLLRTEASILTDSGRVDEGVALINKLITTKPIVPSPFYDDFSNYLYISGLYFQAKRSQDSLISAQKALTMAQSEERKQLANLSIATAKHQLGDYKNADSILLEILKKTPENPIALNNLGYFWLERNEKISEAIELIKKAVKIDSRNSSYLDSLGWGLFKLGELNESEKYLKEAIRINPTSSTSYDHLGDVYLKQGKTAEAKNAWQKAIDFSFDSEKVSRIKEKLAKNNVN